MLDFNSNLRIALQSILLLNISMTTAKLIRLANLNLLKRDFGTLSEIAKRSQTSAAYLSQILTNAKSGTGAVRGIGDALARKLEAGCGKPVGWMDSTHTEGDRSSVPKNSDETSSERRQSAVMRVEAVDDEDPRLTVIPKVKLRLTAGISGFNVEPLHDEDSTSTVPTKWVRERGFKTENLVAIDVRGESMEPTFYEGDTIVLHTADTEPADGGVFAINYEGEPVVKRLMRDAGQWWLTSDNADQRKFQRKLCRGDGCIIVGRVVRRETERF